MWAGGDDLSNGVKGKGRWDIGGGKAKTYPREREINSDNEERGKMGEIEAKVIIYQTWIVSISYEK